MLNFEFLDARDTFTANAINLQTGGWNDLMRANTINAILATYPPLQDPTGGTLTKPRFKKKRLRVVDPGTDTVSFVVSDGSSFSTSLTLGFSAEITSSTGFTAGPVKAEFSVGKSLTITLTSVQEVTSEQILSLNFQLINNTSSKKSWRFFRDRVFKNWVIIDVTTPIATSGQPTIQGAVLDANGYPVAGAVVAVTQNTFEYSTRTNSSGYYQIATPQGEWLATGYYSVTSGSQAQTVNIGSGASYADIYGVNPSEAQNPVYRDTFDLLV